MVHVSENHKRKIILSQPVDSTGQVIKDKKAYPPKQRVRSKADDNYKIKKVHPLETRG